MIRSDIQNVITLDNKMCLGKPYTLEWVMSINRNYLINTCLLLNSRYPF